MASFMSTHSFGHRAWQAFNKTSTPPAVHGSVIGIKKVKQKASWLLIWTKILFLIDHFQPRLFGIMWGCGHQEASPILQQTKRNHFLKAFCKYWIFKLNMFLLLLSLLLFHDETTVRMSGIDVPLMDQNETGISSVDNGTFLRFSPTSASTSAAASSPGRPGNVYVYVWLFLGLLVFLLTLLVISLHRLKNIISSSSSVPDCSSEGGSSFTNMEICSISSQRSTISALSTWGMWEGAHTVQTYAHVLSFVHAHANKGKHAHTYKAHRGPAPPHCDIQTQKPFVSPKEADIMALQSVHAYSNSGGAMQSA